MSGHPAALTATGTSTGVVEDLLYESAGRLPEFAHHGADLEEPGMLERVVGQLAWRRELILVCGDAKPTASSANGLNTLMQLRSLKLHHVLYLSDSAASCAAVKLAMPAVACVWSSRIPSTKPKNGGLCVQLYWGYAFYFYDLRKHYAARMTIELGINVLQTDTDVVWLANPYPALKTVYGSVQIVAMSDRPMVNAGVFYAQNVTAGDGAAWVLRELARRIHTFILRPSAVKDYVPWAQPPFYANVDEQTLMNDCVRSAIANVSSFAQATAGWEVKRHRTGTLMNRSFNFKRTPEYRLLTWLNRKVPSMAQNPKLPQPVRIREICGHPTIRSPGTVYPLHSVGSSAPARATVAVGPTWLFMHLPSSHAASSIRRCRSAANASAHAAAAAGGTPADAPLVAPFIMGHLAGVRTGAWSRRALMRAYGWWHPQADLLISRQLGWGRRTRTLLLLGGLGGSEGDAAADVALLEGSLSTQAHLDVLAANLLLLGLLSNRRVVVPEVPCSLTSSSGRGYGNRQVGARPESRTLTCAWMPPKDCWAVEYVTQLEYERERKERGHVEGAHDLLASGRAPRHAAVAAAVAAAAGRTAGAVAGASSTSQCESNARQLVHSLTLPPRGSVAGNTSLLSLRRRLRELVCDSRPALAILPAAGGAPLEPLARNGTGRASARRKQQRMAMLELLTRTPLIRHPKTMLPALGVAPGLGGARAPRLANVSIDRRRSDMLCIESLYKIALKPSSGKLSAPKAAASPSAESGLA